MAKERIIDFDDEGVTFIFPAALDDIFVERFPKKTPKAGSRFQMKRFLINVKLFKKTGDKITYPSKFNPPFKIEIHYKDIDDTNAGGSAQKQCGYHDGTGWVIFDQNTHGFKPKVYNPNNSAIPKPKKAHKGAGVAKISTWPDPVVGWGP